MTRFPVEVRAEITDVINTRVLVVSTESADHATAWKIVRDAFGSNDVPSTFMGVIVLG